MEKPKFSRQWQIRVVVDHGPAFGHRITAYTQVKGRDPKEYELGNWRGLGIPEPVLTAASARVTAMFEEHLITRYGVAGELPYRWAGEVGPF